LVGVLKGATPPLGCLNRSSHNKSNVNIRMQIKTQIQYCSDLHLNNFPTGTPFETFVRPVKESDVLIIAGDICPVTNPLYGEFLLWCRQRWQTIVVIAGNHEYFCKKGETRTFEETDTIIRNMCKQLSIFFLQAGQSIKLPGTNIRCIGATLWSAVDPAIWQEVEVKKGDYIATYQSTQNRIRHTIPSDITAYHALHKVHMFSAIAPQAANEVLVVVTHHMPTMKLLEPQYRSHRWRTCYASNDEDLFANNIAVWICGHGHRATKLRMPNQPLFLMNSRGYLSEIARTTDVYDPEASFIVKN